MLVALQSAQCEHHALSKIGPRTADVVAHGNARADHVLIGERTDRHLLTKPVRRMPRCSGSDLALLAGRSAPRVLEPACAVEAIEHRGPPVERAVRRPDGEHGRSVLREADPVVAGIPDVSDAHGLLRARVEVPVLPVEERALRHGRRARERERAGDDGCGGDERKPTRAFRQPGQQNEHDGEDHHTAADLPAACKQRRGPAGADEKEHDGEDGVTGGDGERDGERERENRGEKHVVHVRVCGRVDG